MPILSNPRWERFAQELAKGTTADKAYVLAGYTENRKNATRLKTNEDIGDRVKELLVVIDAARFEVADLNAPVDVAFDTNGDMLVLERGKFNQSSGWISGSGRLLRIKSATGERQMILEGLTRLVWVPVWDNRRLVVSELGGNLCFLTARSSE